MISAAYEARLLTIKKSDVDMDEIENHIAQSINNKEYSALILFDKWLPKIELYIEKLQKLGYKADWNRNTNCLEISWK